jgi:hypothetical protein
VNPYEVSEHSENVVKLENRTKRRLQYETAYSLDYFNQGKWVPVQINDPWPNPSFGLMPGETDGERFGCDHPLYPFIQIPLYSIVERYNNSKKGKYRIGRKYELHSGDYPVNSKKEFLIKLYFEFVIL